MIRKFNNDSYYTKIKGGCLGLTKDEYMISTLLATIHSYADFIELLIERFRALLAHDVIYTD